MKKDLNFKIEDQRAIAAAAAAANGTRPAPLHSGSMISYEWFKGTYQDRGPSNQFMVKSFEIDPVLRIYLDTGFVVSISGAVLDHMMGKFIGDEVIERLGEGVVKYDKDE